MNRYAELIRDLLRAVCDAAGNDLPFHGAQSQTFTDLLTYTALTITTSGGAGLLPNH